MQQLRPHLHGPADFAARVRRMAGDTYRILGVWHGQDALALAGYRLQENLIYGRFLYVDDLVTTATSRGRNFGARLLDELSIVAAQQSCAKLVLDTGLSNALAQRFYFRQGLVTGAMRFSKTIDKEEQ
nr:GNAT family N-acetyltransferase [Bordetella petrii]